MGMGMGIASALLPGFHASTICVAVPSPNGLCRDGELRDEFFVVVYAGQLDLEMVDSPAWWD